MTSVTPSGIIIIEREKEVHKMYEYTKGNYVYYGNKECGNPVREIKTVSQKEADYWDRIEKQIRQQNRK